MARLAAADDDLLHTLQQENTSDLMRRLRRYPEFRLKLRAYLERFGERCTDELKLESATLHENPLPLLRAIAALAGSHAGKAGGPQGAGAESAAPGGDAASASAGGPLRQAAAAVGILLGAQERPRAGAHRENLRYERTRVFGRVRTIFLELGRRFHAAGSCRTRATSSFWRSRKSSDSFKAMPPAPT